jgi:hypothetical protein
MNVLLSSPASQDELLADHTPAARQSPEGDEPPARGCPERPEHTTSAEGDSTLV